MPFQQVKRHQVVFAALRSRQKRRPIRLANLGRAHVNKQRMF
jgi:hypothetical protein